MSIDFFKSIYNDDIIYHYTKASTAIDLILFNNQLKFATAKNSNDPIESSDARRVTVSYRCKEESDNKIYKDAERLHKYIEKQESNFQQICFCKNVPGDSFASEFYYNQFTGNEELFGFAKPRMWDQYGDRYSGVCIAFSKEKILALNTKLELIEQDIEYLTYRKLSVTKVGDVQHDHLFDKGFKSYRSQLETQIRKSFFVKHIDYCDENEYRIGTMYRKDKCTAERIEDKWVLNKTVMLDISDCIEAIFVSSYAHTNQKNDLLEYANPRDIPLIEMRWLHNTFECIDYKKELKFWKEIIK